MLPFIFEADEAAYIQARDSLVVHHSSNSFLSWLDALGRLSRHVPPSWFSRMDAALPLQLVEREIVYANLPRDLDGFRILHLADLHFDGSTAVANRLKRCVAGQKVDLVAMTGDYYGKRQGDVCHPDVVPHIADILRSVESEHGIYATLGGHDGGHIISAFRSVGIHILVNQIRCLQRGEAVLQIIGTEDTSEYCKDDGLFETQLFAPNQPKNGAFGLVLAHSADAAHIAARHRNDLYLTGHTHGGQICRPNGKAIIIPLRENKECVAGMYTIGGLTVYTSRGIGTSLVPVRTYCPAEVTLFTLRAA